MALEDREEVAAVQVSAGKEVVQKVAAAAALAAQQLALD